MKNPCLIISTERPSIMSFASEKAAHAAAESWTRETDYDPRWQIVDLEVVTVIWGDDEYTGPGVFNFTPVVLTDSIAEMGHFGELARRQFYAEKLVDEPDLFLRYEPGDDSGKTDIGAPISLEEYLETSYTLITVLPGRIDEIGG